MNPVLDDVRAAFDGVATHAHSLAIDRKGVALPAGGHFQGTKRLGSTGASAIHHQQLGYRRRILFRRYEPRRHGRPGQPSDFSGPFAAYPRRWLPDRRGLLLVVGVEDFGSRRSSEVQFWSVGLRSYPGDLPSRSGAMARRRCPQLGRWGMTSYR